MSPMPENLTAPELAELFANYLHRQAVAHDAGWLAAEPSGEVVPYDAVPVQSLDPRLAWDEAMAAAEYLQTPVAKVTRPKPPDWAGLVSGQEPVLALPFCLGNFPQMVRNLSPLLHPESLALPRRLAARMTAPGLLEWADRLATTGAEPQPLLAAGVLDAALANEEAALSWHRGRTDEAARAWQAQPESVPVLFNRGMAALFLGRPAEARSSLGQAAASLPESSGWHHLARLYLAVAEMHE